MESDQNEVQNVRNNATEHNPRPDGQINRTEPRLFGPVRHAKSIGQVRSEVGRVESESDRGLSLLSRLGRANDRSDELIRHFDQFMNFDQPNLSKARLLRLSDDIASIGPEQSMRITRPNMKTVPAVYCSLPRDVLSDALNLDKGSRRVQIDQSTLFSVL
ncbi:hypothetical protein F2Q68_00015661 [Brassica cretica]|uniref:Uncharacterized protein n=1 Tax=Brassica cretica TaxID=69181 RepID=A0A8S9HQI3_BRACR|nr:hypothetical protein F2Q68_00015661 [Brassica cretica]